MISSVCSPHVRLEFIRLKCPGTHVGVLTVNEASTTSEFYKTLVVFDVPYGDEAVIGCWFLGQERQQVFPTFKPNTFRLVAKSCKIIKIGTMSSLVLSSIAGVPSLLNFTAQISVGMVEPCWILLTCLILHYIFCKLWVFLATSIDRCWTALNNEWLRAVNSTMASDWPDVGTLLFN